MQLARRRRCMTADVQVAQHGAPRNEPARELVASVLRVLVPILLALIVGGIILLILGKDPLAYYGYVVERGLLTWGGLQETFTRMSPLLLIAAGLIVAFRAGIWNLGGDGQFLLAAVITAALAPALIGVLPKLIILIALHGRVAIAVAALWSVIPAILKARYGINEIITSLMMSFLGISFANVLVKLLLLGPRRPRCRRPAPCRWRTACRACSTPPSIAAC